MSPMVLTSIKIGVNMLVFTSVLIGGIVVKGVEVPGFSKKKPVDSVPVAKKKRYKTMDCSQRIKYYNEKNKDNKSNSTILN